MEKERVTRPPDDPVTKQRILKDLIHDVRNPIAVIHTTFEILLLKRCRMDPDQMFERILSCKAQLDRIRMMLTNFVDMNRLSDVPQNRSEEDMRELLDSVMEGFFGRIGLKRRKIRVECDAFRYQVDAFLFRQFLFNMVEHVLLISGPGSESTLRCFEDAGRLRVTLDYTGAGDLSDDEREKIFDPGERIVDKETGVRYNKGFGLTYNRLMAEALGGSMRLEINPESGTHLLILDIA